MMPATMPAASWLRGELRDPRSTRLWTTNVSGSAPYFSEFARLVRRSWVKFAAGDLGLAARDRLVVGRVGQHLAVEHDRQPLLVARMPVVCPAIFVVTSANCLEPVPLNSTLTT